MEEINKIYVGNLDYNATEEELRKAFEEKGIAAKEVKIITDKYSGKSKGFGFVELETQEMIDSAINSLDGQDFKGRKLRIRKANKPNPRPPRSF